MIVWLEPPQAQLEEHLRITWLMLKNSEQPLHQRSVSLTAIKVTYFVELQ